MARLAALLLATLLAAACAPALPSEKPLGVGPLALAEAGRLEKLEAEREARKKSARGAAQSDAPPPARPSAKRETPGDDEPKKTDAEEPKNEPGDKAEAGKKPDKAAAALKWAGLYVGSDTSVFKLPGVPERPQPDPNAKTRVEDKADGSVDLIAIDSSNGKDICTLNATPKGKDRKVFDITRGQKCFEGDDGAMSGTITKGTARFDGKKLVIDMSLDIEAGPEEMRMKGKLEYHFEGTKQ